MLESILLIAALLCALAGLSISSYGGACCVTEYRIRARAEHSQAQRLQVKRTSPRYLRRLAAMAWLQRIGAPDHELETFRARFL